MFQNFWLNCASVIIHNLVFKGCCICFQTKNEERNTYLRNKERIRKFVHFCRECNGWSKQTQAVPSKALQATPCGELETAITEQESGEQREMK